MAGRDFPGAAGANRYFEGLDQRASLLHITHPLIKGFIHLQGGAFADLIGRRIVFVHGTNPRSVMGRRRKHLQQLVFGIVEIQAHGLLGRTLVAFDQKFMDLPVAGQPWRLKT